MLLWMIVIAASVLLDQITKMIEQDSYFAINRARQYGKTTSLMLLWKALKRKYVVISISFEGMGKLNFYSWATDLLFYPIILYLAKSAL